MHYLQPSSLEHERLLHGANSARHRHGLQPWLAPHAMDRLQRMKPERLRLYTTKTTHSQNAIRQPRHKLRGVRSGVRQPRSQQRLSRYVSLCFAPDKTRKLCMCQTNATHIHRCAALLVFSRTPSPEVRAARRKGRRKKYGTLFWERGQLGMAEARKCGFPRTS